jgi:hypothetical protein
MKNKSSKQKDIENQKFYEDSLGHVFEFHLNSHNRNSDFYWSISKICENTDTIFWDRRNRLAD